LNPPILTFRLHPRYTESCVCCVFPWQRLVGLLTGSSGKEGDMIAY